LRESFNPSLPIEETHPQIPLESYSRMLSRTCLFSILILFGTTKLWAQTILRVPYLTRATSNSILIHWKTDIPVTSNVEYGIGGILNQSTTDLGLKTDHVIQLNNLQAGTKYHYQIGTSTQILAGDSSYFFKTMPLAGSPITEPVRIWAVGDLGKKILQHGIMGRRFSGGTNRMADSSLLQTASFCAYSSNPG